MRLSKLSITARLYVIFALLAAVTVALAIVAILHAVRHVAMTKEFESAFVGAENVERVNSLIYAVVMESRGIYMSPDIETAKNFAVVSHALQRSDRQRRGGVGKIGSSGGW